MRTSFGPLLGLVIALSATPAFAEDTAAPPAITINATAAVVSDYRFRGISQTDKTPALQGSITLTHESGFYVSVWGSSIDSYVTGSFASHQELDLIAGFKKTFNGTTLDVGALYYVYPKGEQTPFHSNFIEPYAAVSHTFGPATAKVTVNWSPKQKALALSQTGLPGDPAKDNVYLGGDLSGGIPGTPISVSGHLGHSFGTNWLVPQGAGKDKGYTDWGVGVSYTYKALTLGVNYIDTDTKFIAPSGKDLAKGGVVVSLTAAFGSFSSPFGGRILLRA
jgi:uncharacterized protein (TIGR02001 family)